MRYLTIHVRSHEGRYHGVGDDPPSPFRLFQALVAGAGISGPLDEQTRRGLSWLEGLPQAPVIASPRTVHGQRVSIFMPGNDLDAVGGDPRRIGEIRTDKKVTRPLLFDAAVPWTYAWPFKESDEQQAVAVCALAEKLYQLGRGVDMAWAWGELLDESAFEARLAEHDGVVRRPSAGDGLVLACPCPGSIESLERRHRARRFRFEGGQRVFVKPPPPSYRELAYESPPARHLFDLRSSIDSDIPAPWPLASSSSLVIAVREAARAQLHRTMPSRADEIDRYLVGRRPDGSNAALAESRVRIIPIPSIGMHHADREIRRLLVEVPAACPLRNDDVRWAFSGAELFDSETGELKDTLLSASQDDDMLRHYGVGTSARVFRSVTPVALPLPARRRLVQAARKHAEPKSGLARVIETTYARGEVVQALRHAGVCVAAESIWLQREPFDAHGVRAEAFAEGTRFEKGRLWHVEIAFAAPVEGPLVIGDGRFLGLGLMAPVPGLVSGAHTFAVVDGLDGEPQARDVARALRRAVMARVQAVVGERERLAPFFSGHEEDGSPVRRSRASHLAFAFEPGSRRLLVLAPHLMERRTTTNEERKHLRVLDAALVGFRQLRAGIAGRLTLSPSAVVAGREDSLFGQSRVWETVTPYVVTRHARGVGALEALTADVRAECHRLGLPEVKVEPRNVRGISGTGLAGDVILTFSEVVTGPILLGRTRYFGGGLFRPVQDQNQP